MRISFRSQSGGGREIQFWSRCVDQEVVFDKFSPTVFTLAGVFNFDLWFGSAFGGSFWPQRHGFSLQEINLATFVDRSEGKDDGLFLHKSDSNPDV